MLKGQMQLDIIVMDVLFLVIPLIMFHFGDRQLVLANLIRYLHD